jgi:hypothetical protein
MGLDISRIQQKVSTLTVSRIRSLHTFPGIPADFRPWLSLLSPSALYNCSMVCRKRAGMKTPEVKWMSVKRWVTTTPSGILLPAGVYFSVKRKEEFRPGPEPFFDKKEYVVMMFPYGNIWSQSRPGVPITEEWLLTESNGGGELMLELLMLRDAAHPIKGYFESCYRFKIEHPDQVGIHLKRKRGIKLDELP